MGNKTFKFSTAYNAIRQQTEINNYSTPVWHKITAKKIPFSTYKACLQRLLTMDRLTCRVIVYNNTCELCANHIENHEYLFMQCDYRTYVWNLMLAKLELPPITDMTLLQKIEEITQWFRSHGILQDLAYTTTLTINHHIWVKRNGRKFERKSCYVGHLKLMEFDVRI